MTALLCLTVALFGQASAPPLYFRAAPDRERQVVAQLSADLAAKLNVGRLTQEQGEAILVVSLIAEGTKAPGPAMLGKYERVGSELVFTPRFPFGAGQTYRAILTQAGKSNAIDYRVPVAAAKTPPRVVKIYPTSDVLPANHLKFYIYFDRPMRGGKEIFKHFAIIDDKGKEVDEPWLIDEIWDEENNCLILYIHPGRIKWGVELRELMGPVLVEKRSYSLVIRGELVDLEGNKIGKDTIKTFRTVAEDRVRIDLGDWKLAAPRADSREPLTLTLPKIADHRSLLRFLSIADDKGNRIAGTMLVGKDEKSWQFTPTQPWPKRGCRLDVSGDLEDVAGNTPLRPFDQDLQTPKLPPQRLRLEFQPR